MHFKEIIGEKENESFSSTDLRPSKRQKSKKESIIINYSRTLIISLIIIICAICHFVGNKIGFKNHTRTCAKCYILRKKNTL